MLLWDTIESGSYSPEDLKTIIAAYEGACRELGVIVGADDTRGDHVARAVFRAAKEGVGDVLVLQKRAVLLIRNSPKFKAN